MGDDITIGVTEIVNNIEVTAQPNDQIVDISVVDNTDEVTLNITPTVIEINVNKGSSYAKWGTILGTLSDQEDLQDALDLKADLVDGKVPSSQLPSYVDDVIEVANYAALPATGESGKIYITLDDNHIFRWTGSTYVEITDNTAVWGAITGTLSSQTDLQSALNLKANDNAVVHLTGNENISGTKTFGNTIYANGGAGEGEYAIEIDKSFEGEAIRVKNASSTTFTLGLNGAVSALRYVKTGGTSSEFLKADGTVDSNVYALDSVVVKLTGNQSISGKKSFNLVQTGYNLSLITSDIFSDGTIESNNGMLRLVNNTTSADLFRLESDGTVFAKAFKKDGGTSSEFLMADGSVTTGGLSGTTNYIPKFTSSNSIGNSLIYEIGSTIGIGTTSPFSALHIKRNASELLRIARGSVSDFSFDLGASNDLYIKNNGIGTTPLTILSSGNVGIGTMTPELKMSIVGEGGAFPSTSGTSQTGALRLEQDGSNICADFGSNGSSGVWLQVTNKTNLAQVFPLLLNPNGGNVGIGTTNPTRALDVRGLIQSKVSGGTAGFLLDSDIDNAQFYFAKNGTLKWACGTNTGAGGANDYAFYTYGGSMTSFILYSNGNYQFFGSNVSDRRAKEKIEDLDFNATEKIMALQPKSYYMKNDDKKLKYGFIAQDVYEVLPDLISGDLEAEGFVGLDYNGIIPILVQSIQELKAEIELLKAK